MTAALTYHSVGVQKNKYLAKLPTVDVEIFKRQLKFLLNNYNIVGTDEFLNSNSNNNILLTFDDGLKCHYDVVAPLLSDLNIPAIFFVSSGPAMYRESLLFHQLQILISESKSNKSIFKELFNFATKHCDSMESLINHNPGLHIHKYESSDYNFIKKSFQIFIDFDLSMEFLSDLISRYCGDQLPLFDDIYMSFEDCTNMIENGFDIGAHSKSHRWMEYLSADLIKNEIETDCQFINSLNIKPDFYCYPYGSGSRSKFIIDALTKAGFKYAFSIDPGKFNFLENDPYKIKRYDVNQFFFNVEI